MSEVDPIEKAAAKPKRMQDEVGSVEQHSLPDQIAADKHLANKRAGNDPAATVRNGFLKVAPQGTD